MISAPTIEPFEIVKSGHRVVFSPKAALAGPGGVRKPVHGRLVAIDAAGRGTVLDAGGGQWIVPMKAARRERDSIWKEFSRARRQHETKSVYGHLTPQQKKALSTCAKTARMAALSGCLGDYSGPMTMQVRAEMKRCRDNRLKAAGYDDLSDRGQRATAAIMPRQ